MEAPLTPPETAWLVWRLVEHPTPHWTLASAVMRDPAGAIFEEQEAARVVVVEVRSVEGSAREVPRIELPLVGEERAAK